MLVHTGKIIPLTLALLVSQGVFAQEASDISDSLQLIPFASDEGMVRLGRSQARVDFPVLANQFEPQYNGGFCGPTSAAIVLNALYQGTDKQPRDSRRIQAEDLRYVPPQWDMTVPRFTQDTVIENGAKSRAQVFGEPIRIGNKDVRDFGYQISQFEEMLKANGALTQLVIVDDNKDEQDIRAELIGNMKTANDFVLVNYKRSAVGQKGGGHISPLAAYDEESDSFLVLDVNPAAAGWVWMEAGTLIQGMRTFDTVDNRGYVLLSKAPEL